MNYQETYNNLKALKVRAFSLSKQDRAFVRDTSKELSVEFVPRVKCLNCYADQIMILLLECKKYFTIEDNKAVSYKMVNGKNILWRGFKINDETLTNELAEKFIQLNGNWSKFIEKK